MLLQEGCSKEDKPGAVGAHSTDIGAVPQTLTMAVMGMVTGLINSTMVIRQGKIMSLAGVHPDDCSGTLRDRVTVHKQKAWIPMGLFRTTQGCWVHAGPE